MQCPKCNKGELQQSTAFTGNVFTGIKKIVTTYCPLCDYQNSKLLPSSLSEKQNYQFK